MGRKRGRKGKCYEDRFDEASALDEERPILPPSPRELEALRKRLGPEFAHYSEAQLIELRHDIKTASRLLIELWMLKK